MASKQKAGKPVAFQAGDASTFPANTSAGNMTEAQKAESNSPGQPTTGGLTPKISPENIGNLTELEREQLARGEGSAEAKLKQKARDDREAAAAEKAKETAKAAKKAAKKVPAKKMQLKPAAKKKPKR